MSQLSFSQQAEHWGRAFEILVKRGVLAYLVEGGLVSYDDMRLAPWREVKLSRVCGALISSLEIIDEAAREVVRAAFEHLALTAYGLGYTATREYLRPYRRSLNAGQFSLKALYCPLALPGEHSDTQEDRRETLEHFAASFGLAGRLDPALTGKGMPPRADFLLWLSRPKEDLLLAQEYSFAMPPEVGDFSREEAHLDELLRHRRTVESRSVFARITAEVEGETFELSPDFANHLMAFTSRDKPLYKLCQASAYAEATVRLLREQGLLTRSCIARALAITPHGLESIAAPFEEGSAASPRRRLMEELARAYRMAGKPPDDDEALTRTAREVFNSVRRRLPQSLQKGFRELSQPPEPGADFTFAFQEDAPPFANPAQRFTVTEALELVDDSAELADYFSAPARQAVKEAMQVEAGTVTLRNLHAAAVIAGMRAARPGRLNVLALEGNPGIGKTTAITRHLGESSDGFLFLYLSPRVVINRDVTEKMARRRGQPTGTLTVTTNAELIAAAKRWYETKVSAGKASPRRIEAAVVVDGVAGLKLPDHGSTVMITPEQEHEIESKYAGSRLHKSMLSEHEDLVQERPLPGVLASIADTTRQLLSLNPAIKRVAITAALQGFREKANGETTVKSLSQLFKNRADYPAGIAERRLFAERHPTIVVMVDELAGDGAGAPFVHTVARWLDGEFIEGFSGDNPFTVILVISDASLSNEVVMDRFLNAGSRVPDKVLVSASQGARPFTLVANTLRLDGKKQPTLHIITNSFPASRLSLQYRVRLSRVRLEARDGVMPTPRKAVREAMGEQLLESASGEIRKALEQGAQQVIYFAQDKQFLSEIKKQLVGDKESALRSEDVEVLDSSVPAPERKRLVQPERRDKVRVFLMTSSGARGVSFPKTDWIIATVPRFNVEASLMEIAQLCYRGRGSWQAESGKEVSGDDLHRHLVMLVDDFLIYDEGLDVRQWLRNALDLMTLLVMLRSTIFTRITGDSQLRQKIAFVPVGSIGVEELVSIMAQPVAEFLREAAIFIRRSSDSDLIGLVRNAESNIRKLFESPELRAIPKKGADGRSAITDGDIRRMVERTTSLIMPLLARPDEEPFMPDQMYFSGPVILDNWERFEKLEAFRFEGHQTMAQQTSRKLLGQLSQIDKERAFPAALRRPAASLHKLLSRKKSESGLEFRTLKYLNSPNTWVALPAGYTQFARPRIPGQQYCVEDPESWLGGLISSLGAQSVCIPAIARYESFPWAASVGQTDPLRLSLVFDDRYFMASNELNLLNMLLLTEQA